MAKKISELFMNSLFEYDSYTCKFEKDIENVAPDQPPRTTLTKTVSEIKVGGAYHHDRHRLFQSFL